MHETLADWLLRVHEVIASEPRSRRVPLLARLAAEALENSTGGAIASATMGRFTREITTALDLLVTDAHQARAALVLAAIHVVRALDDPSLN